MSEVVDEDWWAKKPFGHISFLAVLIVCSAVPVSLGGGILSYDLVIPGLFALTLIDVATRTKTLDFFIPRRGNVQAVFVTLFFFTILVSYARKPLLPAGILGTESDMTGVKLYWRYFSCFLAYFTTIYWVNRNRIAPTQLYAVNLYLSLFMTLMGFTIFLTGVKIPGLSGHIWEVSSTSVGATRLPFLGVFAQLGFLICLTEACGRMKGRLLFLAVFAAGIFLSGGRTVLFSTIAAIVVFLALNRSFLLMFVGAFAVAVFLFSVKAMENSTSTSQVQQFARVGSLSEDSVLRYYLFQQLVDEIRAHPIFGTGFGKSYETELIVIRGKFVTPDFVDKQLRAGSHGTHLQLMKNLGIVGYLPFLLVWIYPLFKLMPYAFRPGSNVPTELVRVSRFAFVLTCALFIRWGFEGNGSRIADYVIAAIFCGAVSDALSVREKLQDHDKLSRESEGNTSVLNNARDPRLALTQRGGGLRAHKRA